MNNVFTSHVQVESRGISTQPGVQPRRWPARFMSLFFCTSLWTVTLVGCDLGKVTVGTTSEVLVRGAPALEQEADYDLAARALPGTLKTIESFWYVDKDNAALMHLLAKGFCQYGTGFIEDELEEAELARDFERAEYITGRATRVFVRCTNYALRMLGKKWQEGIYGEFDAVRALLDKTSMKQRDALMWAAIGLASTINLNKDNVALVSQVPTAKMILHKVVELDDQKNNKNLVYRALPHVALGMAYSAQATMLGGKPELSKQHFSRAIELTEGKFLLAKVMMARRYAVMIQDRELFRSTLVEVLQTPASIWPEQRLANEIAHRRARRYLKHEKEWF